MQEPNDPGRSPGGRTSSADFGVNRAGVIALTQMANQLSSGCSGESSSNSHAGVIRNALTDILNTSKSGD
jgi:hypothetical protein